MKNPLTRIPLFKELRKEFPKILGIMALSGVLALANWFYHEKLNNKAFAGTSAAQSGELETPGATITAAELENFILRGENILLLDARVSGFYEKRHIPGAHNLPESEFEKFYPRLEKKIRESRHIIIYCANAGCQNSEHLATRLQALGHVNISLFPGGQEEWDARRKQTK